MGGVLVHDEELAAGAVGVGSAGHADHAAGVLDGVGHAVGGELALDLPAGAAGAVAQRAAALDHEPGDDPVEGQAVVKAGLDQFFKILAGDGGGLFIELDVDDAAVFHSDTNHSTSPTPCAPDAPKGRRGNPYPSARIRPRRRPAGFARPVIPSGPLLSFYHTFACMERGSLFWGSPLSVSPPLRASRQLSPGESQVYVRGQRQTLW